LAVWLASAVVLFWLAPTAPDPIPDAEQEAARQRMVEWAIRDAKRWHEERGDIVLPWRHAQGHLAIVIDDVGRELEWFERLQALRFRLTFSVLPGSSYAAGAQLRLRQDSRRPREIMLHLPMEPIESAMMTSGAENREEFLRVGDAPELLQAKLERALRRVPSAVGVNNHMGSKLTEDPLAMDAVMAALASRGLFFIDSRTSSDTVAERRARQHAVASASRHLFLDHDPSQPAIRAALEQAVERSRREPIIVIAHPSQAVVEVLEQVLPGLAARKVGVYPVSEVLAHVGAHSAQP
jgi:polysaccharide deacetylase 2 family uncharacterized protein YibQ